MSVDNHHYLYDPDTFLITALDLPASMEVLQASADKPYLGLVLKFDLKLIGELILQAPEVIPDTSPSEPVMTLGKMTPELFDAFVRLVSLLDEPASISVLAPLIEREIYWRILMSEQGARLKQIVSSGSKSHRIAKSIEWLKKNYNQPFRVDSMAEIAQMSSSTFHHYFRELTAMTPLQYQKHLRLTEARRLMLGEHFNAADVAYHVGYESPSQFSREYSRLFGAPPKRDIEMLRQNHH
jgi:transcriptional regulator GlxA family with amidase domain